MVKVSVVVPVYNVENYIRDCLDSLINQTLKDIEIICINDGSPDNSLEILKEYASEDNRITVIDQENGGHAVATNRGIKMAKGDYLFCMDSDDILELNALELSYKKAVEHNVDFVLFKAINYDDPTDNYYETEVYSMDKIAKKVGDEIFTHEDIGELMFEASVTPWSKLYNRKFIVDNNIHFPEGLIFEDNVFFYDALFHAKSIYFLKEFLFIRRWYATSSTTAGDLRFLNSIDVINLMIEVFKKHGQYDTYKEQLINKKISTGLMRYEKIKQQYKDKYYNALSDDFISIFNDPVYYNDVMTNASYFNKKVFEQVLISENNQQFDLLRKTYQTEMKNQDKIRKICQDIITDEFTQFNNTPENIKPKYYQKLKETFTTILKNKELFNKTYPFLSYKNKKIFEKIIFSDTYQEYAEIKKLYYTQQEVNYYKHKIPENKEKLREVEKQRKTIENSNSWQLTKPLRAIKR